MVRYLELILTEFIIDLYLLYNITILLLLDLLYIIK